VRDAVLNKPGPLSPKEFEEIRLHVLAGEEILEPLRRDHPVVLDIVRSHHEHLDGTGFPDGLAGDEIPLLARVVSVADAFDAMTTSRAYRECRNAAEGWRSWRGAGRQFDPLAVAAFRRAFPDPERMPISVVERAA
jgi:HD-GYP domain-containing protein (c-di-GMP phosphodiesterase class II)